MDDENYIKYNPGGQFAGADRLLNKEWEYLQQRDGFDQDKIKGLALSGGGIRSASFCLGVAQSLAANGQLKKMDYLSTVSGGGYLGGALSWLWSGKWKSDPRSEPVFGVTENDFPFGTEGRRFHEDENKRQSNTRYASLLRHLRQHGKYLTPGHGITALSFISIILRSLIMGFVTLIVLAGFVFSLFYLSGIFEVEQRVSVFFRGFGGSMILLGYVGLQLLYMVFLARHKHSDDHTSGYLWRRKFETLIPIPLKIALFCYLLAAVHYLQVRFSLYMLEVGSLSALLGGLFGALGAESKFSKILVKIPQGMKALLGAALMIFGLLVLADTAVSALIMKFPDNYFLITSVAGLLIVLSAYFLPINNISIHRYYRDRLMETFMPDVEQVLTGKSAIVASKANRMAVGELGLGEQKQAPYHLINTNVILVESDIAKFRGRGGDNFIISPLYCGSNATGWQKSDKFCHGQMTLPTAVAISGAAANPDAGVAGQGLTTNPSISILMSIFNLRLGYWATNPDISKAYRKRMTPNYLIPGFVEVLRRKNMNENAPFVQLSDGGHFENLGLYELFRRKARLIIVCDAGADPNYEFSDLANAIEKARVDFGVKVHIDQQMLNQLIPADKPAQDDMRYAVAEKAYLLAKVDYHDGIDAQMIYIKTTLSKNVSADIHGYKRLHPAFPDETTVDQFFDEVQFEAYRELGWQITQQMLEDKDIKKVLAN